MNRTSVVLVAVLVATRLGVTDAQQGAAQAEKLLASAHHKASIDGDVRAAIEEYKRAFTAAGSDRALAAQALVRMAECQQRLGQPEARATFARVVRDYADQESSVALARTRLEKPSGSTGVKGDRSVWTSRDADGFGTISPDGRYLTYTDWSDEARLALRDLATNTSYPLTSGGWAQFSAISRDGKWVAYEWTDTTRPAGERRPELRVARLHERSISDPRRLFDNDDIIGVSPYDWSPDDKWIAVQLIRKDRTRQLGLAVVDDGSLRVLKSLDWKKPTRIFFSPDGRYIGYDLLVSDSSDERHVFVMAVDGSRESAVAAHPSQNVIMGWSPDGRHVLFSSDRSGTFGLWAVPIDNGKASGGATLVKPDVLSTWSLGLTAAGTMYVWKGASPISVQVSSVDMATGALGPGAPTFQRFVASALRPDWSPDGKYLSYQSCDPSEGASSCTLWIRSMESGALRQLKPKLGYFFFTRWSPDGRELLTPGIDIRGRNQGLYRIDAGTGEATLLTGNFRRTGVLPQWTPDGKHLYHLRDSVIFEHELGSGRDREVVRLTTPGVQNMLVSPDGQYVAYRAESATGPEMFVMPLAGGAPRTVLRAGAGEQLLQQYDWTSDGRALVVGKYRSDTQRWELWICDAVSAQARRLDIDTSRWNVERGFRFDRTGKQVAYTENAGESGMEIRALENFLPGRTNSVRGAGTPNQK